MDERKEEKRYSFREYEAHYFPNKILDRLAREVSKGIGSGRAEVKKHDLDPRKGLVELKKPLHRNCDEEEVRRRVKGFYQIEKFEVFEDEHSKIIEVSKEGKNYWVMIFTEVGGFAVGVIDDLSDPAGGYR